MNENCYAEHLGVSNRNYLARRAFGVVAGEFSARRYRVAGAGADRLRRTHGVVMLSFLQYRIAYGENS